MPDRPDGSPMSGAEMWELLQARGEEVYRRLERDGCCFAEGQPYADGYCYELGVMCPLVKENEQCREWVNRLLAHCDGASQQTLADECAARLIDA